MNEPIVPLRFAPSRVEGMPAVKDVAIHPDRIELTTADHVVTHRFADIARWPFPRPLWKVLFRLGVRPRSLFVADRDWFQAPAEMYFAFYTTPPLKIFMPQDERKDNYPASYFARVQAVLHAGGFATSDLG